MNLVFFHLFNPIIYSLLFNNVMQWLIYSLLGQKFVKSVSLNNSFYKMFQLISLERRC